MAEPSTTEDEPTQSRRPSTRALAAVLGVALLIGLAAVGVASVLDDPVGSGARDVARPIVAGPVVAPGQELTGGPSDLPPLALVLDRPPPGEIGTLPAEDQVPRLQALALSSGEARRYVELGAALQASRRLVEAREAFESALRLSPDDTAARVGLALTTGAEGPDGLERAATALDDLEARNPDNQIVTFNNGWLSIYRRDAESARRAWERTVALAPQSRLGETATSLLEALEQDAGGGQTSPNP